MARKITFSLTLIMLIITFFCCHETEFSPYDTPIDDIAVTCIIDSRIETNLVRIQKIYLSKEQKSKVGALTAYLSDSDGREFVLQDTLIKGSGDYLFYKIPKNYLKRGTSLRLAFIGDEIGKRRAEVLYFKDPELSIRSEMRVVPGQIVDDLYLYFTNDLPGAFLHRLFIDYEELENNSFVKKTVFVPVGFVPKTVIEGWSIVDYNTDDLVALESRVSLIDNYSGNLSLSGSKYCFSYDGEFIHVIMKMIGKNKQPENIRIKGVYAVLYQIDLNYYYNYLAHANERFSIRLDEQVNLSNVYEGNDQKYGLLGVITVDTIRSKFDGIYLEKLKYINAQQ